MNEEVVKSPNAVIIDIGISIPSRPVALHQPKDLSRCACVFACDLQAAGLDVRKLEENAVWQFLPFQIWHVGTLEVPQFKLLDRNAALGI